MRSAPSFQTTISPKSRGRTLLTETNSGSESISACRKARFCRFSNSSSLRAEMSRAMIAIPSGVAMTCWRIQRASISASLSSHSSSRQDARLRDLHVSVVQAAATSNGDDFAKASAQGGFLCETEGGCAARVHVGKDEIGDMSRTVALAAQQKARIETRFPQVPVHRTVGGACLWAAALFLRLTGRYAAGNRASLCGSSRSVSAFTTP